MSVFIHWLTATVAVLIAAYIVPGATVTPSGALITAVVLGALNLFIKPIVFLLTLPLNILTLGLFSFIIHGFLVWLAAAIVPGFEINGFLSSLFFAVVLAIVNWVFHLWRR
jgi:putative membrane protein